MTILRTDFPPVRACLFDMDGLLINTEDIYTICHNSLLARYSRGPMTWSIKSRLQGLPAHEAIKLLYAWAKLTDDIITPEEYTKQLHILQEREFRKAEALPGVEKLLSDLSNAKSGKSARRLHIALATSSHKTHFDIKTRHLGGLFSVFVEERTVLGDDKRIPKGRGKLYPDIYLLALKTINDGLEEGEELIRPEECLVLEDGIPGVVAGRRAGMRVVWVPHPGLAIEYQGKEAQVLAGLGEGGEEGESGKIGDGYGEQLVSVVDFPYARYGIAIED